MASVLQIQELNRQLATRINQEARADPRSPYAGKLVGIANGEVVVVALTWEEVIAKLHQVEPDRRKTLCLEASADYDTPVWI